MIAYSCGRVKKIVARYPGSTELLVQTPTGTQRALNYHLFTGPVQPGDQVLLNTTAVELGLGSGGYHFVVAVGDYLHPHPQPSEPAGHIMKLRYTPLQFSVLSVEEENSPHHELFHQFETLAGLPVIIGELHSMLLPAVFNIHRQNPQLKIAYIMTDGGALPAAFSHNLAYLKKQRLIAGVITYGQAFGGDLEAVNIYTALIAAKEVLNAHLAVVTMGPGITGTGTKYGWSGLEQGPIIDAVNTLGGRPLFIPRISFADQRPRHRGLSHHSITVLSEIAQTPAQLILPKLPGEKYSHLRAQLQEHSLDKKHRLITVTQREEVLDNIRHFGLRLTSMGRTLDQTPCFFLAAGSAGYYGAQLASTK
ncbi:MAG: DUF3866 family protein [Firmicutes bacterium]|nr:DUF3866 family protein [Bacillota bacterium]